MSVIQITKNNFDEEVLQSDKPVLLDFWASWCGPCQMIGPIIEEIANERSDVKVGKVNVDEERFLALSHQVMSIPTLMVFKNGELTRQEAGFMSKDEILSLLA